MFVDKVRIYVKGGDGGAGFGDFGDLGDLFGSFFSGGNRTRFFSYPRRA